MDEAGGARYPDQDMPFAPEIPAEWIEFADRREEFLLDYGYNTARAYWADLQDWFEWAVKRGKNMLALTERDKKQYVALLRRRKYSESTIRRRLVVLGRLILTIKLEEGDRTAPLGGVKMNPVITGPELDDLRNP